MANRHLQNQLQMIEALKEKSRASQRVREQFFSNLLLKSPQEHQLMRKALGIICEPQNPFFSRLENMLLKIKIHLLQSNHRHIEVHRGQEIQLIRQQVGIKKAWYNKAVRAANIKNEIKRRQEIDSKRNSLAVFGLGFGTIALTGIYKLVHLLSDAQSGSCSWTNTFLIALLIVLAFLVGLGANRVYNFVTEPPITFSTQEQMQ